MSSRTILAYLLARAELIPGEEPLTIAVEAKHHEIVDRPEVVKALWGLVPGYWNRASGLALGRSHARIPLKLMICTHRRFVFAVASAVALGALAPAQQAGAEHKRR